MAKFTIHNIEDWKLWDKFVEDSIQGTIFSKYDYLESTGLEYKCFYIQKGKEVKAGVSIVLSGDKCVLDDMVIYNGIIFKNDVTQKPCKAMAERFNISEFVINCLTERYQYIELALAPQFKDLRPFLWHNYHSEKKHDKFELDLRYTSYLNISELSCS